MIAGVFFLSRRKGVTTRDLAPRYRHHVAEGRRTAGALPSRGEGRAGAALGNHSERLEWSGRLCEGHGHNRPQRGRHGEWIPRRPPAGNVARARDLCCALREARRGEARRRVARTRLHASPTTTANGSGRGKSKRGKGCGGPEGRSHASLLIPTHTAVHPTPPQTGPAPARPSGNTPPRGPRRHGGPQHLPSSLASEGDLSGLGDRPAAPQAACRREPAHRARTHTHRPVRPRKGQRTTPGIRSAQQAALPTGAGPRPSARPSATATATGPFVALIVVAAAVPPPRPQTGPALARPPRRTPVRGERDKTSRRGTSRARQSDPTRSGGDAPRSPGPV